MTRILLTFLLLINITSCKELFQYSPNEVRLEEEEKNLNQKNIARLQAIPAQDQIKFVVIGDSQRFYDDLDDFVTNINLQTGISFVLLNGDISDFGLNKEFKWINRILKKLTVPYFAVIGNHDMLANGRLVYNQMFGAENFSFTYGSFKFIGINTNSQETGYDGSIPDLPWLQRELAGTYKQAFVFSHVPPFSGQFDEKKIQDYTSILRNNNVGMSIHGHQHDYSYSFPYADGVPYLVVSSMNKRSYAIVSVNNESTEVEEHHF
jgi:3',5'-cyclic-AMP phosphodiesterase